MVVFPEETKFYTNWQRKLEERGVKIRLRTEVAAITQRSDKGVKVQIRERRPTEDGHIPTVQDGFDLDMPLHEEEYDEIVLCCLADTAKRLLGKTGRWIDKKVLGSAKWSDDITVTHTDTEYMKKWYTTHFDEKQAVRTVNGRDDSDRTDRGKDEFNP